ncbi:PocR ligand-binding domain-containing protein [Neobacillus sp. OS1-32]|jgi:LytS/YehU family sensor histidine kinase|uniref:PocR ligand-binding domain-containing protein n=1 Tax=Neobacillus paridis TaxID=2803862 RepID=A0ABS1TMW7_9BACI|nr:MULTISPECIES: PocR ligand-binding domain-containing protein [Neobacillus]MBL4951611.1 PocR ligand-binding domain-containing protein [Neobacillus paridis]WML28902.1 PocR ligand-binding domain-containing protein [Neobacillus sp. OS1-32]
MNLQEIIDINLLQKIQDSYAESTGLAAITVDFKGNPIAEYSNFSGFCNCLRQDPQLIENCFKCDAYGGLEAARRGTFYVYKCHAGLVDLSVPIIVKGQWIGSMQVGQARISDEEKDKLDFIVKESSGWQENKEIVDEYNKIPISSLKKIEAAAEMMFYVINHMFEQNVINLAQEELQAKNQQLIQQMKVQADLEKALLDKQIRALQLVVNPHFLFNALNAVTCLSIVENAPRTQDVIVSLADIMKYILTNYNRLVSLKEELSFIDDYLKLQKLRFKDRIQVFFNIDEEIKSIELPSLILQSIIDNAIVHGIEPKDGNGIITIKGYPMGHDSIIEVTDNGVGITKEKIADILADGENMIEQTGQMKGISLRNVNSILISHYGNDYRLSISQNVNGGTTVKLKIPNKYDREI